MNYQALDVTPYQGTIVVSNPAYPGQGQRWRQDLTSNACMYNAKLSPDQIPFWKKNPIMLSF